MPPAAYKIAEARARSSELLARARAGVETVITRGRERGRGPRESAPLAPLRLPDDLFDDDDPEQAAIDAGDYSNAVGIWRGGPGPA